MSTSPARRGLPIGLVALLGIVVFAIGGVIYGGLNRPHFDVFLFDAGPIEDYQVGKLRYFPQARIYVIALDEDPGAKNLRALDALSPHGTRCVVRSRPRRCPRGGPQPARCAGRPQGPVLAGPSGTSPVMRSRAPASRWRRSHITQPPPTDAAGRRIVEVEVIGRRNLADEEPQR